MKKEYKQEALKRRRLLIFHSFYPHNSQSLIREKQGPCGAHVAAQLQKTHCSRQKVSFSGVLVEFSRRHK